MLHALTQINESKSPSESKQLFLLAKFCNSSHWEFILAMLLQTWEAKYMNMHCYCQSIPEREQKTQIYLFGSISKSHGIWTEDHHARLKLTNIDERCSVMWCLLGAELQKSTISSFFGGRKDLQVLKFINNLALQFYYSPCLASSFRNQCLNFY